MAILIPKIDIDNWPADKPKGERNVYYALNRALNDDWTIFYSLKWTTTPARKRYKAQGEGDFILLHKTYGIVVIEVKGGGVELENGVWTTINAHYVKSEIQDPKKQADDTKFELVYLLREKGINVHVFSAVWFPDITVDYKMLPAHIPDFECFDERSLKDAYKSIINLIECRNRIDNVSYSITEDTYKKINAILNKRLSFHRKLKSVSIDYEESYFNPTLEQYNILDQLNENDAISVCGHAGTGKTVIALASAIKETKEGKKIAYICYNERLCAKMEKESGKLFDVYTIYRFAYSFLKNNFPNRVFSVANIPNHYDYILSEFCETVKSEKCIYDQIYIDEAQDFEPIWIQALQALTANKKIVIFYDPLQNIYERMTDFSVITRGTTIFKLRKNMRNTDDICRSSLNIIDTEGMDIEYKGITGRPPDIFFPSSVTEARSTVSKVIGNMLENEGFTEKDITILTYAPSEISSTKYNVEKETIRRFKGLENNVIIITDIPAVLFLSRNNEMRILYAGMSRAKIHLVVIVNAFDADEQMNKVIKDKIQNGGL